MTVAEKAFPFAFRAREIDRQHVPDGLEQAPHLARAFGTPFARQMMQHVLNTASNYTSGKG